MIFSGLFFMTVFLPILLILYYAVKNRVYRNIILTIASLIFYAWGEPVWIIILLACSVLVFLFSLVIQRYKDNKSEKQAKCMLISGIVILLAVLSFFKYSGFIADNVSSLLNVQSPELNIALPLGISFYTFTCIAYLYDVYKGKIKAQKNYSALLMYISMFFTVTSGPIQRYKDVQSDLFSDRETWDKFSYGVHRFIVGLAKKTVIANTAGSLITSFTGNDYTLLNAQGAWIGIILYSLQIYFDFSGYSDMAIGLASMFGFSLKENFNYPYASKSATEFWRRWHISLGSFFRDYVYIPLGGNRVSKPRWILNLLIVWSLTGLWHGAGWNFIIWGLYFFVLLLIERLFLQKLLDKLPGIISHIYFILLILVGWVFFYNTDISNAFLYIKAMFTLNKAAFSDPILNILFQNNLLFIVISTICAFPVGRFIKERLERVELRMTKGHTDILNAYLMPLIHIALFIISLIFLVGDTYTPFLYFNF